MGLWGVAIIVFILNLPFGYWRANTKRFSLQWFVSIHAPIVFIIAFRIFADLGWQFITFPVLIGAFTLGQFLGGKLHSWWKKHAHDPVTSCLVYDMMKTLQRQKR